MKHVPLDVDISFSRLRLLVEDALTKVNYTKSPGYPLNIEYASNKIALSAEKEEIILAAVARLHMRMTLTDAEFEEMLRNPLALLENGITDPSSIFIKTEPHPSRKHEKGNYRPICPGGLVDLLVETVMYYEPGEVLKDDFVENGSAVGIGFTDSMMEEFRQIIMNLVVLFGFSLESDVSGFDAGHTPQYMDATVEVDRKVYFSPDGLNCWNRHNKRWASMVVIGLSVFGKRVYIKSIPGGLDSGKRDTTRRNTTLRPLYSHTIAIKSNQSLTFSLANGDDGADFGIKDLAAFKQAALDLGIKLRDVKVDDKGISFCSHFYSYEKEGAELQSWPKLVYKILCNKGLCRSDAYQAIMEMRHNGDLAERLLRFLSTIDMLDM